MIHLSSVMIDGEECAVDVHYKMRELTMNEKMNGDIRTKMVIVIEKCELIPDKKLLRKLENAIDMELGGE